VLTLALLVLMALVSLLLSLLIVVVGVDVRHDREEGAQAEEHQATKGEDEGLDGKQNLQLSSSPPCSPPLTQPSVAMASVVVTMFGSRNQRP